MEGRNHSVPIAVNYLQIIHNTTALARPLQLDRLTFDVWFGFPADMEDPSYRVVFDQLQKLATDNVGLGNVSSVAACLWNEERVWVFRQLPTGLTFASRV